MAHETDQIDDAERDPLDVSERDLAIAKAKAEKIRAFVDGLRELADFCESHPWLAEKLNPARVAAYYWGKDPAEFAKLAFEIGEGTKDADEQFYRVERKFGPHILCAATDRDLVCTARVVGTREVVEEVPDPALVAAIPLVEVTRTEPIVEWDCPPSLGSLIGGDAA